MSREPGFAENYALTPTAELVMCRVGGKPFRCDCGCNVFRKPNPDKPAVYECNACGALYEGASST